jgi:hypothetical protein
MHILSLPDDILSELFRIVVTARFVNFGWNIRYHKYYYFTFMGICKKFKQIGRKVFDHSAHNNHPLRNACAKG